MTPSRADLLARARAELIALYGEDAAGSLCAWMSDRPPLPAAAALTTTTTTTATTATTATIDQRTSILTVYPDHIGDDAGPPLAALDGFLRRHLAGAFTHLHVLPFTCADGDDGYAITDHRRVHPRLGDWEALRRLGEGRQLVCDFVANHVSTAHPLFLELCARGESPYFLHRDTPAAATWGYRVRKTELYQPFATAAGPRWVFCTYGRSQADLDYRSPRTLRFALEELEYLLSRGAAVLRLDALPHLWKAEDAWGPHHPNVVRLLRVLRCFTELVRPGALLFAETQHRPDGAYFDARGAQLGNELAVPLLLLGCLAGDCRPLEGWLRGRAVPDPTTTPLVFLNTHDGMHLLPMSCPLPAATAGPLFERLRRGGVVISYTDHEGQRRPYELNSPLAKVVRALCQPDDAAGTAAADDAGDGAGAGADAWIDGYLALHAVLLALPGIPQIYFPNLVAVHADAEVSGAAGAALAHPRSLNRRKHGPELEASLAAPAPRVVLDRLLAMLAARAALPGLHPHAPVQVLPAPAGVLRFRRGSGAAAVEIIANFSAQPFHAGGQAPSIDALAEGGASASPSSSPQLVVAPRQVRWLISATAPTSGPAPRGARP